MPTKTKPKVKSWFDDHQPEIIVKDDDLKDLYETVNIDAHVEPKKAIAFDKALQMMLQHCACQITSRMNKPLPAHVIAELAPIHKHATALAQLLHPCSLSIELQHALDMVEIDDGSAWELVSRLGVASRTAETVLAENAGSGQHNHRYKQELELAKAKLSEFFIAWRTQHKTVGDQAELREEAADKMEFIAICLRYLPKIH